MHFLGQYEKYEKYQKNQKNYENYKKYIKFIVKMLKFLKCIFWDSTRSAKGCCAYDLNITYFFSIKMKKNLIFNQKSTT